ncbi:hypothetical protein Tco_1458181 [Tanacetum coccineum]
MSSCPNWGQYGPSTTTKKVFDADFYWPTIFKEAHTLVKNYDVCQHSGSLSRRDEMPQYFEFSVVVEILCVWRVCFSGENGVRCGWTVWGVMGWEYNEGGGGGRVFGKKCAVGDGGWEWGWNFWGWGGRGRGEGYCVGVEKVGWGGLEEE